MLRITSRQLHSSRRSLLAQATCQQPHGLATLPNNLPEPRAIAMKRCCIFIAFTVCALLTFTTSNFAQKPPDQDYLVYVLSESADKISLIRFGPAGAKVEKGFTTGLMEPDIDGPHGIAYAPDRQTYFVSLGHGRPFGTVW